jgi:hypothetical protein
MSSYDWSTFTTRIAVDSDIPTQYKAWATRNGIEHWFLKFSEYKRPDGTLRAADEEVQSGDTYTWRWHGWPDEVEEKGTILDCNGKDFFKFTFGEAGICSVTIRKEQGYTMIELVQTDIPTDDHGKHYWHLGCKNGWSFYLVNLKSLFEGGIDLRNKDLSLKNVVNA